MSRWIIALLLTCASAAQAAPATASPEEIERIVRANASNVADAMMSGNSDAGTPD